MLQTFKKYKFYTLAIPMSLVGFIVSSEAQNCSQQQNQCAEKFLAIYKSKGGTNLPQKTYSQFDPWYNTFRPDSSYQEACNAFKNEANKQECKKFTNGNSTIALICLRGGWDCKS